MTDKTAYFAVSDANTSPEKPRTVLRRVEDEEGQRDELFSRNLQWEPSPLLLAAERGDTMFEFTKISKGEADRIVANTIRTVTTDDNA